MEKFDRLAKRVGNFLECFMPKSQWQCLWAVSDLALFLSNCGSLVKLSPAFCRSAQDPRFDPDIRKLDHYLLSAV
jgi:hypothetical protein